MVKYKRSKSISWLAPALLLAYCPFALAATHRTTIEQLQQILTAAQSAHKSDEQVAAQLAECEPATQLNSAALQQMLALSPGPKSTQALRALADDAVFLDPAPSDIPQRPAPEIPAQKAMLAQTVQYVARTLSALPNFFATRKTDHFEDTPSPTGPDGWPVRSGMHFGGSAQSYVSYKDGRETDDPRNKRDDDVAPGTKQKKPAKPRPEDEFGLSSWGEFGPILGVVLVDASKGQLSWARWQTIDGKPAAVFQFRIDRKISHYVVQFADQQQSEPGAISYGGGGQSAYAGPGAQTDTTLTRHLAGYHGLLTVNPEDGTILRITIEADLRPEDNAERAAMMVEYGPVKIGDHTYTCPIRSVTISSGEVTFRPSPAAPIVRVPRIKLNDVQFTDYRRFGSESAIIIPKAEPQGSSEASSRPASAPNPVPASAADQPVANKPAPANPVASETPPPAATSSASATPPTHPAAASENGEEILISPANELPGMSTASGNPGSADKPDSAGFTLKVSSQLVDINLIAYDKHNKPITDLKPDEIEIYDNGKKQQLKNFQHPRQSPPAPDGKAVTNAGSPDQPVGDLLILLIDESHLPFTDLNRARFELQNFLKSSPPTARIALYSITEHGSRIIQDVTQDHALIAERLAAWMPDASSVSRAQDLDTRNRQQIDTVRNPDDLANVNGNIGGVVDYIQTPDPALRQMGDNPLRASLESMIALARHFASTPGHKSLVWITGDSALVDREDKAVNMEKGDKSPTGALAHTRQVFNEARMALYAVDASELTSNGGAAVDASLYNPAVGLDPTATANSKPGGAGLPHGAAIGAGRALTDMQENSRPIQTPVRTLAEATGGQAIRKGGDLEKTLTGIENNAGSLYELGFYPDTPADNKFHTLLLKVPSRKDVQLRYRTGYQYTEEAASTKQRFQDAVWAPQDLTGVSITADAVAAEDSATGKPAIHLRIALKGLDLQNKDDHWTDNLYVFLAQRDDAAQKAEVDGDTLRLKLKPATYASGMPAGIPYRHEVSVLAKLGSIRVIVVDGNSGRIGSVTLPASAFRASTP